MTYAVIMAGGIGSRFWPRSRRARPKQFLSVFGDASLLQNTVFRLQGLIPPERCFVVTNSRYVEETRNQLPEMDFGDRYQKAMIESIYAGHGAGPKKLEPFLRVQTLWDESMAENIVRHMADQGQDHRMVVLAGGYHISSGFGIPRRVYRRMPSSYVLVGSRELVVPDELQHKLMDVKLPTFPMVPYDYLVYTEYETLPGERVKLGVRMKEEDGKVVVEAVVPGSAADSAGVAEGDIIVALDGEAINENFDLIYAVMQHASGDQSKLIVERNGEQLELDVTFAPLP